MFNLLFNFLSDFLLFIGYLSNLNSFPKPLSKKEEMSLIEKFKQGDEEAKNILIERNLRLVAYVSKKYYQCGKEYEDLISIGTIGLIKAINNFNTDKGIRLATYAVRCIQNEILMCLRSEKKLVNEVSLNDPIGFDPEGNEINLMDVLSDDEESVFNEVNLKLNTKKLYEGVKTILDEREKEIIVLRYGLYGKKALTQRQIAKKLDISRSYVSRIEKKAIDKLTEFFSGN